MADLYWLVFRSMVAGVILALVWWLIWGRKAALPAGPARGFTLAGGLLVLLGLISMRLMNAPFLLPFEVRELLWRHWYGDYRFAVPLSLGIFGLVLLALPVQARRGRGAADLTRRSLVSFARPRWFVAPGVILVLILLITVVAGAASQPDTETGRYTMYFVDLGGERGMGTGIYGWFYSVPAMILTAILIIVTIAGMSLIARPALAEDQEQDIRVRTIRTRNILTAGTGALLVHLGLIFSSLAGTASVRSSFSTSDGTVRFWTTFSALEPALVVAAMVCAALGVALWAGVALSAIPLGRRAPVSVGS